MDAPHPDTYPLPRPGRPRTLPRLYIASWVILATGAVAYLCVFATNPELVSGLVASLGSDQSGITDHALTRSVTDLKTETQGLRQNVGQLQTDVANVRTGMMASEERAVELAGRIAALEKASEAAQPALAPVASLAAPAAIRKTAAVKAAEARRQALAATAARVNPPAGTAANDPEAPPAVQTATAASLPGVRLLNPPAAGRGMETGSIAARSPAADAPVTFGQAIVTPAPATPAPKPLAVQIASGSSVDALRLSWNLLADRNADALGGLQPRYVTSGEGDVGYGLVAGPIRNSAEAKRVCGVLQARGIACRISAFDGNAL